MHFSYSVSLAECTPGTGLISKCIPGTGPTSKSSRCTSLGALLLCNRIPSGFILEQDALLKLGPPLSAPPSLPHSLHPSLPPSLPPSPQLLLREGGKACALVPLLVVLLDCLLAAEAVQMASLQLALAHCVVGSAALRAALCCRPCCLLSCPPPSSSSPPPLDTRIPALTALAGHQHA